MPNDGERLDVLARCAPNAKQRRKVLAGNPPWLYAMADRAITSRSG